jgi:hypothetical protein
MLKTVADLLRDLQTAEANALSKLAIKHPGVIGEMYEGLTSQILDLPLPPNSELRVTTGFIRDKHGHTSRQIDCMIVMGKGESIPHTRHEIVSVESVILAVEVKKNLYSKELKDAYENLLSVKNLDSDAPLLTKLFSTAFKGITGYHLPTSKEEQLALPFHIQHIYAALSVDARLPARAVFGYDGFASEQNFREKFFDFLKNRSGKKGYGPGSIPNLITCGKFSIFKANGMPNIVRMESDKWNVLATTNRNPLLLLLEILFCRLNFMDLITDEIFGDFKEERANSFISAQAAQRGNETGWEFFYQDIVEDVGPLEAFDRDWSPVFVNQTTWVVLGLLCKEPIDINDHEFRQFLIDEECSLDGLLKFLRDSRLAALSGTKLKLLTKCCRCGVLPDGRFIAGEDSSGQLTKWICDFAKKKNQNLPQT